MDHATLAATLALLETGVLLGDYARHRRGCEERRGLGRPCDCGLDGLLAAFEARTGALRTALDNETESIRS